ncbi:hypothetical protein CEXT_287051 [Caerostris extrusa]|uniref:Uncharacterized protein n=1 Tax=Caerostris extrusa TaxID=172846 RepID=A0AAV4SMF5_CAEEX|nr:hypothetical protein CEXT_287051 [Caerostris extrusa]
MDGAQWKVEHLIWQLCIRSDFQNQVTTLVEHGLSCVFTGIEEARLHDSLAFQWHEMTTKSPVVPSPAEFSCLSNTYLLHEPCLQWGNTQVTSIWERIFKNRFHTRLKGYSAYRWTAVLHWFTHSREHQQMKEMAGE